MPLSPGTQLGSYEILGKLGEGGMGEVYRARDSKLNRDVALKVLPDLLAGDTDRLARFRREAQVLASLNHPNIAHIHGFEDSGTTHALVMELVEGRDLSQIVTSPLALADALPIARQIIDALEAAHDQGIVHRDLKPANVKVRDDGTVKVLDFGLAKAMEPADPSGTGSVSNSPTLTARATQMGMILGTAAYMAPEQARGRAVDRRADIWAFGVVLYEMLTGKRAFEGDDISITLASVLKEDVKWDALPADLPASIRRLLRRCLEKDPKRRLSAIGDARLELDDAERRDEGVGTTSTPSLARKERWMWAGFAGVASIAAVVLGLQSTFSRVAEPPVTRFSVFPPGDGQFSGNPPRAALSPDGRSLVFAASLQAGAPDQLWLRRLDSTDVTPISGTESGPNGVMPQSPFWSPDGRRLAFFLQTDEVGAKGESRLRTVDLQGGGGQTVCTLPSNNAGGSWNADGVMLVASQETKGIQRVPASGGTPIPVTTLDTSRNEVAHLFPQFLPDGRHFIFQVLTKDRSELAAFVGSLDSADRRLLVRTDHARFAAPNLLVYVKDDNLVAQVMNPDTQELSGEPQVIATGLEARAANGRAGFTVSDTGVLVHYSNADSDVKADQPNRQLTWFDRRGTALEKVGALSSVTNVRLSPNATHAALVEAQLARISGPTASIWVTDLGRNVRTPLTPANGLAISPTWSSDGERLVFSSGRATGGVLNLTISERAASGATPAAVVHEEPGFNAAPLSESADGKTLVFAKGAQGRRSLHVLSRSSGKPSVYLSGEFDYPQASLSPDGRWLAYVSNESGTYEVIVQPFPDLSRGKWQISTNGGVDPRWRRDGRELFFVDGEHRLASVAVSVANGFQPGRPTPLFPLPGRPRRNPSGSAYMWDAAPDGQRFLVSVPLADLRNAPLTVTTNWTSLLLASRAPSGR